MVLFINLRGKGLTQEINGHGSDGLLVKGDWFANLKEHAKRDVTHIIYQCCFIFVRTLVMMKLDDLTLSMSKTWWKEWQGIHSSAFQEDIEAVAQQCGDDSAMKTFNLNVRCPR